MIKWNLRSGGQNNTRVIFFHPHVRTRAHTVVHTRARTRANTHVSRVNAKQIIHDTKCVTRGVALPLLVKEVEDDEDTDMDVEDLLW